MRFNAGVSGTRKKWLGRAAVMVNPGVPEIKWPAPGLSERVLCRDRPKGLEGGGFLWGKWAQRAAPVCAPQVCPGGKGVWKPSPKIRGAWSKSAEPNVERVCAEKRGARARLFECEVRRLLWPSFAEKGNGLVPGKRGGRLKRQIWLNVKGQKKKWSCCPRV